MFNRRKFLFSTLAATTILSGTLQLAQAETTDMKIQLSWLPNAGVAGEIVALKKGFFKEAGLNVELLPGGPGSNAIQELLSGTADVSIGYAPGIMYSSNRGLPIKSFGAGFQKAPLTFYSLAESNIKSIADWKGKRVGAGQGAIPQVKAILNHNGLKFEDITFVQAQPQGLMQNQVDVAASWPTNLAQLAPILSHPAGHNAQSIWDNGLQFQSNYYIARNETLADNPEKLVAFLEAVDKGWNYVADNKDDAVKQLVEFSPALDAKKARAALDVIVGQFIYTKDTAKNGFGYVSDERWQQTLDTYIEIGELKPGLTVDKVHDGSILKAAKRTKR